MMKHTRVHSRTVVQGVGRDKTGAPWATAHNSASIASWPPDYWVAQNSHGQRKNCTCSCSCGKSRQKLKAHHEKCGEIGSRDQDGEETCKLC